MLCIMHADAPACCVVGRSTLLPADGVLDPQCYPTMTKAHCRRRMQCDTHCYTRSEKCFGRVHTDVVSCDVC